MEEFPPNTSLETLQSHIQANLTEGIQCPCCNQFAKLYKRKITSSMAWALLMIFRKNGEIGKEEYFHVENFLKEENCPSSLRGDFHKLRHWDLIEKKPVSREDGSDRNGYYRISEAGVSFAKGEIRVREHARIYNNTFYGFEGEYISIQEALKNKFDYTELMNSSSQLNFFK